MKVPEYIHKVPSYYSKLQKVPGDSPAYYTSDPSNDVLQIESIDVVPNPPIG
jgi:hypothetical protein